LAYVVAVTLDRLVPQFRHPGEYTVRRLEDNMTLLWTVCIAKAKILKYRHGETSMSEPRSEDHQGDRGGPPPPGLPRWLKTLGIVVAAVVVVALIVSLVTGTEHGPGLHESWVAVLLGRSSNDNSGSFRPLLWL
jgi:hypothetical protein